MEPRIENIKDQKLVGKNLRMSFAHDKTKELWQGFMPRRKEVKSINNDLYSVSVYNNAAFFQNFDLTAEFQKWAAMRVENFDAVPEGMDQLILNGSYAVFIHKGTIADAQNTFAHIFSNWLPNSKYESDDRPLFAIMGEKYKNDDPGSEEEIWIPIRVKRSSLS
jgi:AraC family transcriptional regulator